MAACARDCVCWKAKTIASVIAEASVWNTLSSFAGNPNTAVKRTHTTTAATTPNASVGLAAYPSRTCKTRLPGWR